VGICEEAWDKWRSGGASYGGTLRLVSPPPPAGKKKKSGHNSSVRKGQADEGGEKLVGENEDTLVVERADGESGFE
jgi:hypothetical protein